jgi:hypothetical protein
MACCTGETPVSVSQIVADRRRALLAAFVGGFPPVVEVDGPAGLTGLMHLDEFAGSGPAGGIGRRRTDNVMMVPGRPSDAHSASVWVRAGYGDYRPAYAAFLRAAYGVVANPADLAPFDIDHLLNRARAGNSGVLLRIEALPLGPNRQWGAFLEKLAAQATVAGNRRTIRLMSHLIAGKVAGLAPPASLTDAAGRARLAQGIAALGLPLHEVQGALDRMLGHIARNL